MAKITSVFTGLPVNKNARKDIYRTARLGTRPVSEEANNGDAMKTITAAERYRQAFVNNKPYISFFQVLSDAWNARKDWR
jgi:hypothetical protein